ncbi:ubiquitin carboxyl-terminal hydrolase 14 [Laetiporus sulphureus 93-53]|uniref:Ubiquitin carboxyl-terminal hydrolase n=1 Tax=Laetiporus sulphureus 93-53 TaxID=1314785 RepID=A0A165BEV1_9APHY|nr:ubiquitin carboxyl-terminal hydrolase 14 [Laetiporus sulphureus 93-53]KZT00902.1 ubiquitin carboxyl-terminal hydrolase 14 [Laetiporus sulphureus 93-53]
MAACSHLSDIARLQPPKLSQSVHREECTQCFDNQDHPLGIDVCLTCFNGGCLGSERHHARTHVQKSGHSFTLNIKRKLKPSSNRTDEKEPPAKLQKLAIVEDRDEDKYDFKTVLKCWKCDPQNGLEIPDAMADPHVKALSDGVMKSLSSARQSEVKAWEEEITPCEHTLTLQQQATGHILASGLAHCSKCDLKENLWLCLTCGSLGCGRQQFGGLGGNGHGLQHYEESHHPVSVKLGTITPEGDADIYCYTCNDAKTDPELAAHLATFGINVQTQTKTEKSMTELQIEHNLKFDFSLTDESGKALEPVFGPGLTGLSNLGNSCYMASVIQTLFSLPAFRERYLPSAAAHWQACTESLPANCVDCQMYKLADGLLSGRYSHPRPASAPRDPKATNPLAHDSPTPVFQEGVRPSGFKALVGRGHEEFATMRQQDAEEFFTYLLTVLKRHAKRIGVSAQEDPTRVFDFGMEQLLQCGECKRVRYRVDEMEVVSVPVPARERGKDEEGKTLYQEVELKECLDILTGTEALEYKCPACQKNVIATKRSRFATFPQVLVVHAKKFQLVNWVPAKLDIPLNVSDSLQLDEYLGRGLQSGEIELPEDQTAAPGLPQFNEAAMAQLEAMGFPAIRCQKALLATGNNDAETAMEWLFAHMEDPDIDSPIQVSSAGGSASEPSQEQINVLSDMGFTHAQARKALRETGMDVERAVEWLFSHPDDTGEDAPAGGREASKSKSSTVGGSTELPARYRLKAFISHKGPSVHSGHYVAHIRVEDVAVGGESWVLFNDEKVVKADAESVRELKKLAYLYVYERV